MIVPLQEGEEFTHKGLDSEPIIALLLATWRAWQASFYNRVTPFRALSCCLGFDFLHGRSESQPRWTWYHRYQCREISSSLQQRCPVAQMGKQQRDSCLFYPTLQVFLGAKGIVWSCELLLHGQPLWVLWFVGCYSREGRLGLSLEEPAISGELLLLMVLTRMCMSSCL